MGYDEPTFGDQVIRKSWWPLLLLIGLALVLKLLAVLHWINFAQSTLS